LTDKELYTVVIERNGRYACLPGEVGLQNTSAGFNEYLGSFRDAGIGDVRAVAAVHTHSRYGGPSSGWFSNGDISTIQDQRLGANYLGTPTGDFKVFRQGMELAPGPRGVRLGSLPPDNVYNAVGYYGRPAADFY